MLTAPESARRDSQVLDATGTSSPVATLHGRVLLAEDGPDNQRLIAYLLKKAGLDVTVVENGRLAVDAVRQAADDEHPFDVILMDMQMPEMDGYEATKEIRKREAKGEGEKIPIIAMTANVMTGDREKCLEAGMDEYIAKPVNPQVLVDVIEKWLSEKDTETPPETAETGEPVFDREGLLERMMGEEELVEAVMESFLENMPGRFDQLREALDAGDIAAAQRHAHSIKGASANINALALTKAASYMEDAAEAGGLDETAALLPQLEKQYKTLEELLKGGKRKCLTIP
jgi:CheY-like chemotaxis protein/HPt (histidine-containing phosphotransfer) domain-containing protein